MKFFSFLLNVLRRALETRSSREGMYLQQLRTVWRSEVKR